MRIAGMLALVAGFAGLVALARFLFPDMGGLALGVIAAAPLIGALIAVTLLSPARAKRRANRVLAAADLVSAMLLSAYALHWYLRDLLRFGDYEHSCPLAFSDPAVVAWATHVSVVGGMLVAVIGGRRSVWHGLAWFAWCCPTTFLIGLLAGISLRPIYDAGTRSFTGPPWGTLAAGTICTLLWAGAAWLVTRCCRVSGFPSPEDAPGDGGARRGGD